MIDPEAFFTVSGVAAWGYLLGRAIKICNAHYKRLKWALSGYKQPRRFSRHG